MSYPYYYYWRAWLLGQSPTFSGALAHPTLYVFGAKKFFQFHSAKFLASVQATPGGRVERLNAGHWFMVHQAPRLNAVLLEWLHDQGIEGTVATAAVATESASTSASGAAANTSANSSL